MNKTWAVVLVVTGIGQAWADDDTVFKTTNALSRLGQNIDAAFGQDRVTKAWVPAGSSIVDGKATCAGTLAELGELGAPGSSKVKLSNDTDGLAKGEHTLDEILPVCEKIVAFGKTKQFQHWAYEALREFPRVSPKTPYNEKYFSNCIKVYGEMMKAGIPPTYKVPDQMVADNDGKMVLFGGPVEELRKKWCDDGLKNAKAERDRRDAPYKKALKGDKLSIALSWRAMYLPGGTLTEDPAVMAKSNVWFTDGSPGLVCIKKGAPEVHELTRMEFDGASKLVKSTSSKHCGAPPSSAYK